MDKLLAGLLVGVFGGAALGTFVFGPLMNPAQMDENHPVRKQFENELATERNKVTEAQRKAATLEQKNRELKNDAEAADRTLQTEREQYEILANEKASLLGEVEALRQKTRNLPSVAEPVLTPEQREAQRQQNIARAQAAHAAVKSAIEGGDKKAVLAAMKELLATGPDGYEEYFQAYMAVSAVGNPWDNDSTNSLGVNIHEYGQLMSDEACNYALANVNGDVPDGVRVSAAWHYFFSSQAKGKSTDDMMALLVGLLKSTTDEEMIETVVVMFSFLKDPACIPHLDQVASNVAYSQKLRVLATDRFKDYDTPDVVVILKRLALDPNEGVKSKAKSILVKFDPPITGFYVVDLYPGQQAAVAGILEGDIVTSFNGQPVTDMASIAQLQKNAPSDQAVTVEVYRNGATIPVTVAPGELGINGVAVTKK
ncbi:MAG: PDZ domain-containing protein [Planctomycetaceae bacterium]|nr:PDZ domain-containing protein [Planctomycetaceae bacterium]